MVLAVDDESEAVLLESFAVAEATSGSSTLLLCFQMVRCGETDEGFGFGNDESPSMAKLAVTPPVDGIAAIRL